MENIFIGYDKSPRSFLRILKNGFAYDSFCFLGEKRIERFACQGRTEKVRTLFLLTKDFPCG